MAKNEIKPRQPTTMPTFSTAGGEIMEEETLDDRYVMVHFEDKDEPNQLRSTCMHQEDYDDLVAKQKKGH